MSTRSTPWEPGTPCWVDLGTPDVAASHAFYSELLGWEIQDMGPDFGHYAICSRDGHATAGIGPTMSAEQPVAWTTYLAVEDADKTTDLITTNGGTIIAAPMSVADQGRMAIAMDPTGAAFGIWQADKMIGAQLVNEPGGLTWNDHHSTDPDAARAFYTAVFGYSYTRMDGPYDYATIDGTGPGMVIGGIGADPGLPPGAGSYWLTYFSVADTDAAVATATSRGGRVISPATDTPFGRMATLADPQGAVFTISAAPPATTESES
ncbi:MAG TPA: VOC family protein [Kineosporiaceae bacterium]